MSFSGLRQGDGSCFHAASWLLCMTPPRAHSFVSPQVMIHERYLFDSSTQAFTVDKYLNYLEDLYGGTRWSVAVCAF